MSTSFPTIPPSTQAGHWKFYTSLKYCIVDPNIFDDSTEIITLQHSFQWKAPTAFTEPSSFQNILYCLFACYHHLHLIHVLFSPQCSIPFFQLLNISSVSPYTLPSASSNRYIIISMAPLFKQLLQITISHYRGYKEILMSMKHQCCDVGSTAVEATTFRVIFLHTCMCHQKYIYDSHHIPLKPNPSSLPCILAVTNITSINKCHMNKIQEQTTLYLHRSVKAITK